MARPLRIEYPGAIYHVTSRGDRREPIFDDDIDRQRFLATLAEVVKRYNWLCHAYCLMGNHYHLVVETPEGNLSLGMRHLNGLYTQASNRRHQRTGHVFQGRFKAILVDRDSYLLELARYVVLNPVRAGLVETAAAWPWSSYAATVGAAPCPDWLSTDWLLAQFGSEREAARQRYRAFVAAGNQRPLWSDIRQQIYLGDDGFVARVQQYVQMPAQSLNTPRAQHRPPTPSLSELAALHPERNQAIVAAYRTGAYSYQQIADFFGVHLATVGRIVRRHMQQCET